MLAISLLKHIFIRNPDNERTKRNRKVVQEGNRVCLMEDFGLGEWGK